MPTPLPPTAPAGATIIDGRASAARLRAQVAQDVAETAQSSVQQVKEDVKSTAQESAQSHGQQVASSAQDSATQVREQVQS